MPASCTGACPGLRPGARRAARQGFELSSLLITFPLRHVHPWGASEPSQAEAVAIRARKVPSAAESPGQGQAEGQQPSPARGQVADILDFAGHVP